jgi:hypothetical protein
MPSVQDGGDVANLVTNQIGLRIGLSIDWGSFAWVAKKPDRERNKEGEQEESQIGS